MYSAINYRATVSVIHVLGLVLKGYTTHEHDHGHQRAKGQTALHLFDLGQQLYQIHLLCLGVRDEQRKESRNGHSRGNGMRKGLVLWQHVWADNLEWVSMSGVWI